jgi:glutamyl-tRNA synthetase
MEFVDGGFGPQSFEAGTDFGDFVVWRQDDLPAYHLAVTVDDAAMGITEVVRGADLLRSTARQLLLFGALGQPAPRYHHCPLMTDERGVRLATRYEALIIRWPSGAVERLPGGPANRALTVREGSGNLDTRPFQAP